MRSTLLAAAAALFFVSCADTESIDVPIEFKEADDRLVITQGGKPLAEYMKSGDDRTPRPYFRHVHAPTGQQATINNPPAEGEPDDHHAFHVGLFQAFGRLGGQDTWRLKDRVAFAGYEVTPLGGLGEASFAVRNRYTKGTAANGETYCTEIARYTILARPHGTLILWESEFLPHGQVLEFGDQEEMGLALRVNAPMNVSSNARNQSGKVGRILNSRGDLNERGVRTPKQSVWCDYSGWVDGKFIGITLMSNPRNLRQPWWHARDYGLLVCNPFARQDLGGGKKSLLRVYPGQRFFIRYGILIHSSEDEKSVDLDAAYQDYVTVSGARLRELPNLR